MFLLRKCDAQMTRISYLPVGSFERILLYGRDHVLYRCEKLKFNSALSGEKLLNGQCSALLIAVLYKFKCYDAGRSNSTVTCAI